jgi:hypothetical protein
VAQFRGSLIFTIFALILAALWGATKGGIDVILQSVFLASILAVLEVSLSFDNAVVNATVLEKMDPIWQKRFLTWGIAIAVFGMRILFPVIIVSIVAGLDPISVFKIALTDPDTYARYLGSSHSVISAFGGMFLLMVFLKFILDPEKEMHWIDPLEKQLIKIGKLDSFEIVIAILLLLAAMSFIPDAAATPAAGEHQINKLSVLISGLAGLILYIVIDSISGYLEEKEEKMLESGVVQTGIAAFLYLEVLDASFSFDGVIGAFAITKDIIVIAIGLGIGAMFVRSLTVYLVRKGTLAQYIFLEHGAHYAIGLLALIMLISITHDIPEVVTGLSGVFLIGLALISSIRYNRRHPEGEEGAPAVSEPEST